MITIIKGHFICTKKPSEFSVYPNHYLIAEDGIIEGLYDVLPENTQECLFMTTATA